MVLFIQILHVLLSLFLILIILLQPGKDSGAVFGGQAGNSVYASRTNSNPLGRATTVVAVMFMSTSISLAWFSTVNTQDSEDMEKDRLKLETRLTKKDLDFSVPKLPFLQVTDLVAPKVLPIEKPSDGKEIPSDGLTPE
jgi:preprotein translocase subunit SecG